METDEKFSNGSVFIDSSDVINYRCNNYSFSGIFVVTWYSFYFVVGVI